MGEIMPKASAKEFSLGGGGSFIRITSKSHFSWHGWRIVKTPGGAFRLVTVQFIAYRLILDVFIMELP